MQQLQRAECGCAALSDATSSGIYDLFAQLLRP